ncbi:ATP-dependent helicase/deoxyribonuclease subunit B [bioreactor metagenome]|uniref:ATP-dependent helicase/deoxyribonuclease subunit B n=1 Tax=bioreactor metagenome TaxID=1076179 RepID=A0A645DPL3_9ZZZZ
MPEFEFPLFKYEKAKLIGDNGILKSWINNEMDKINNENWKFYPTLFEYNFEFEYTFDETIQSDNETNEKTANGIKIDGKIDRIEISEDGTYFVVADYKLKPTGINTINDMKNGKSLQIPIYLLALKQQEKFNSISPYGGIYYILVDDKTKPTYCYWSVVTDVGKDNTKNIKNTINIDELLNESLNFAIEYKNRICSFSFNSSKNKYCNSCNYKNICRNKQK